MSNVKLMKLASGEEILAEVVKSPDLVSDNYTLKNCIRVVYYDNGKGMATGFAPFMPLSAEDTFTLKGSIVVASVTPKDEVLAEYTRLFSGIVIPANSGIVV